MRPGIRPGGTFPDYALPDHTGTTLSELQGRDPLVLTLARGNYCPKEHQQHLELAANYPKIAVAYTQVATIATDDHHRLQEFRASVGAQWTGRPPPAQRPGVGDVIAHFAPGEAIVRYEPAPPMMGTTGDIEALSMWAGQSVALARQIQPAADIVAELTSRL